MNKRYDKNYGKKDEEEDEEPVRLTLRQRIAEHRLRHPHDLISFGEDPIPKPHKPQLSKREKPSGEFLISRYETRLIEGAKEEEDKDSDENEEYLVNPINHASVFLLVVPVLPAKFKFKFFNFFPVPLLTAPSSREVI